MGNPFCGMRLWSTPVLTPSLADADKCVGRFETERAAREGLTKLTHQVSTQAFVPRKTVTVARTVQRLACLTPQRARDDDQRIPIQPRTASGATGPARRRSSRDQTSTGCLIELRDGGTKTAKGHTRRAWSARSLNAAIDAWRLVCWHTVAQKGLWRTTSLRRCTSSRGCAGRWLPTHPMR